MNVIRLMGGLGNQMFQYALGSAMRENNIQVKFDVSNFAKKNKHREYMLGNFNVNIEFSRYINNKGYLDTGTNPSFNLDYLKKNNHNFFGYFQYLDYFKHILPKLRDEFTVKVEAYTDEFLKMREQIHEDESVGVHVRRDDYVTSSSIPAMPFAYYYEAIRNTQGNLYIFSDDIAWCKRNFVPDYFDREIYFMQFPYYLDFELLRNCKQKVISNSTFSYWAAILSDSLVVTPDFWITRLDRHVRNNFPEHWIKISNHV